MDFHTIFDGIQRANELSLSHSNKVKTTDSARYTYATNTEFIGNSVNETVDDINQCAYDAYAGNYTAFGFCSSASFCKMYNITSSYNRNQADGCAYYVRNDSQPDQCMDKTEVATVLKSEVYDNGNCPTGFTYNASMNFCYANMSESDCNKYNGSWRYPYMEYGQYQCALYGSSENLYVDDYACQNFGSTIQIFNKVAYCYTILAIPDILSTMVTIVNQDGCNTLYDASVNNLKIGSALEMDWIFATFGAVSAGGYRVSDTKFLNYDNTTFNAYGKTIQDKTNTFIVFTSDGQLTTSNSISYLLCRYRAMTVGC